LGKLTYCKITLIFIHLIKGTVLGRVTRNQLPNLESGS